MPNPDRLLPQVEASIEDQLQIDDTSPGPSTVESITQSDKLTTELKAATLSMIRNATLPRFLRFISGVKEQTDLDNLTANNAIYLHSLIHNNEITMQGNDKSFYDHNFGCFYGSSLNDEDKASIYETIQQKCNQKLNDIITQQYYQIDDEHMQTIQQLCVSAGTPDPFSSEPEWLQDQNYCKNHATIVPYQQFDYILNHPDQFSEADLDQHLQEVLEDGGQTVVQNLSMMSTDPRPPLQKAYDKGSKALIDKLINTGVFESSDFMQLPIVSETMDMGLPLAHSLVAANLPQALNLLSPEEISATSDNNQQTVLHYAVTPVLHYALSQNNSEVTPQLLDNPTVRELINQKDRNGNTALHLAIEQDCQAITDQLLNCNDVNVNQRNRVGRGESPLQVAARKEKRDLVEQMLQLT